MAQAQKTQVQFESAVLLFHDNSLKPGCFRAPGSSLTSPPPGGRARRARTGLGVSEAARRGACVPCALGVKLPLDQAPQLLGVELFIRHDMTRRLRQLALQ